LTNKKQIKLTRGCNLSSFGIETMTIPLEFSSIGNITKTTRPFKCREQICSAFARNMTTNTNNFTVDPVKVLNKARIILCQLPDNKMTEASIKKTLKPIRLLEKECKLPRTKAIKLLCTWSEGNFLMFEGSNKWYRSSHTMSLWHMLIRVALWYPETLKGATFNEIVNEAASFSKHPGTSGNNWLLEDRGSIKETIHTWVPLMKNLNKIFPPSDPWARRFDCKKQHTSSGHYSYLRPVAKEGILELGKGRSQHIHKNNLKQFLEN
jgi:hypothetical protein